MASTGSRKLVKSYVIVLEGGKAVVGKEEGKGNSHMCAAEGSALLSNYSVK